MSTTVLAESASLAEAGTKGIWRSRIIAADVQGSSGYYPGDVLRRDGATAFPAGTHVYLDHPSSSEETDRPERSVRDLAGVLIEDANFEDGPDGSGLFAQVQFLPHVKDLVKSIAREASKADGREAMTDGVEPGHACHTQRDDAGYFSTGTVRLESTTAALRSEEIDLGSDENPDRWPFRDGDLATVRVRAQAPAGAEVFVGIGHTSAVDEYIDGVAHDEVVDIRWSNDRVHYRRIRGDRVPLPPPGEQRIWAATAEGPGLQSVTWDVEGGNWSIVV